jgi:hypothetical protein
MDHGVDQGSDMITGFAQRHVDGNVSHTVRRSVDADADLSLRLAPVAPRRDV